MHRGGCRAGLRSKPGSFLMPPDEPLEYSQEKDALATEENYDDAMEEEDEEKEDESIVEEVIENGR